MKKLIRIFVLIVAMNICSAMIVNQAKAQYADDGYGTFYNELSPYGYWVDYPNYGYVWIPNAGPEFTPYATAGHWVFTDYGWTWVSDYPWGWAPFHYGRWNSDPYYGWIWIPGNEWAPAWVSWRRCNGYYGWAPLGVGYYYGHSYSDRYYAPREQWTFIDERHFGDDDGYRYYAPRERNVEYINSSTVINNYDNDRERGGERHGGNDDRRGDNDRGRGDDHNKVNYYTGPRVDEVQRVRGSEVKKVAVVESQKPSQTLQQNKLEIYRPTVAKSSINDRSKAPQTVHNMTDVKPVNQRSTALQQPSVISHSDNNSQRNNQNNIGTPVNRNTQQQNNNSPVNRDQHNNVTTPVNRDQQHNNVTTPVNRDQQHNVPVQQNNIRQGDQQPKGGGKETTPVKDAPRGNPGNQPSQPQKEGEKKDNPRSFNNNSQNNGYSRTSNQPSNNSHQMSRTTNNGVGGVQPKQHSSTTQQPVNNSSSKNTVAVKSGNTSNKRGR